MWATCSQSSMTAHASYLFFSRSDWFGMLHSWADSKKKSNLVLTTFYPGENISWLGNMQKLGPAAELDTNPYQSADHDEGETTPFPVMPSQRRSYNSQANVVWIKPSGLQVCYIFAGRLSP